MNKPTIDEILQGLEQAQEPHSEGPVDVEKPNRYTAVMVTAKRARQINRYFHSLGDGSSLDGFGPAVPITLTKNYLSTAMEEVARGEIGYRVRPVR